MSFATGVSLPEIPEEEINVFRNGRISVMVLGRESMKAWMCSLAWTVSVME